MDPWKDFTTYWEELTVYWKNLQLRDLLAILYSSILILLTLVSNIAFRSFVESKPDGRKTVIGKYSKVILA